MTFVLSFFACSLWFVFDYDTKKNQLAAANYAVSERDRVIALKNETIAGYKEAISSWKERYEQLRWQQRTSPPTGKK
jgi:hypothetical protein